MLNSNMTPRLSSHISIFGLVFLVLRSDFLELPDNRVVKNVQFCPLNLRVMLEL